MSMDAVSLLSEARRERQAPPAESPQRDKPPAARPSKSERPDSGRRSESPDTARPPHADDEAPTFNDHLPIETGAPLATPPPVEAVLPKEIVPGGALAALLAGDAAIDLAAAVGESGSDEAELLASLGLMTDDEGRLQPLPSEQAAQALSTTDDEAVGNEQTDQRTTGLGLLQATGEDQGDQPLDPRLALQTTTESKRSTAPKEMAETEATRIPTEQAPNPLQAQTSIQTQATATSNNQSVAEGNTDQPLMDRRSQTNHSSSDATQIERLLTPTGNVPSEAIASRQASQPQATAPAVHWTQSLEEVETAMDRALAQQIGRAVLSETNEQQRVLTMRLTPPELGTIRIQFVEQGGHLHLRLNAEDDGVRAALERAIPTLRQELRHGNGHVVDVQLADQFLHFQEQQQERPGAEADTGGNRQRSRRGGAVFAIDGATADSDPNAGTGRRRQPDAQALVDTSV